MFIWFFLLSVCHLLSTGRIWHQHFLIHNFPLSFWRYSYVRKGLLDLKNNRFFFLLNKVFYFVFLGKMHNNIQIKANVLLAIPTQNKIQRNLYPRIYAEKLFQKTKIWSLWVLSLLWQNTYLGLHKSAAVATVPFQNLMLGVQILISNSLFLDCHYHFIWNLDILIFVIQMSNILKLSFIQLNIIVV